MQISPVSPVLVKELFPPGPAASGRSGAAAGGARPLPHLENRISTVQNTPLCCELSVAPRIKMWYDKLYYSAVSERGFVLMSQEKLTVAVLFGGASTEHDVSRLSVSSVLRELNREKYEILPVGITRSGEWLLYSGDVSLIADGRWEQPELTTPCLLSPVPAHHGLMVQTPDGWQPRRVDVVFPVLHGMNGEDGTVQGLLELAQLPYVGCGVTGSANCMDKDIAKRLFAEAGIPVAGGFTIYRGEEPSSAELTARVEAELGWPVFVKPVNLGSSVGVSRACNGEELEAAMAQALRFDRKVLVEEAICGAEVECAVMGNHHNAVASDVLGEIVPVREMYDYEGKYLDGSTRLYIPARIPGDQTELIRKTAVAAYRALDCRGLSRVDFFALPDGTIRLNEINTLPGFTSISMFPKLFMAGGYTYPRLLDRLIELALEPR